MHTIPTGLPEHTGLSWALGTSRNIFPDALMRQSPPHTPPQGEHGPKGHWEIEIQDGESKILPHLLEQAGTVTWPLSSEQMPAVISQHSYRGSRWSLLKIYQSWLWRSQSHTRSHKSTLVKLMPSRTWLKPAIRDWVLTTSKEPQFWDPWKLILGLDS